MASTSQTDALLETWGERLFHGMPKKGKKGARDIPLTASKVRTLISSSVKSNAAQVMVKITGGGKGMKAIAAHIRYISRQGKPEVGGKGQTLEMEDERGNILTGSEAVKDVERDWRVAGSFIPDDSHRREAFNIILSMPAGTPANVVRDSARAFASETFAGHKYVFSLHEDTDSPHVHLAVRAERSDGVRLNPRKDDLRTWRARFAAQLQDRGINAVATPAASRGQRRAPQAIWRLKTPDPIRVPRLTERSASSIERARDAAMEGWGHIRAALAGSSDPADQRLAAEVSKFVAKQFEAKLEPSASTAQSSELTVRRGPRR